MKKIFVLFLVCQSLLANAQTEASIRDHYTDINKQITESKANGYEGSLYNNQWIVNKNSRSWPAVGNYNETTDFWYDDPPDHLSAADRDPKIVLLKVNINRKASHLQSNEEFLYKDGKLLFYYLHDAEEGNEWETRVYFNTKGVAFKSSVKANGKELTAKDFTLEDYKDFKPIPARIAASGKKYQELFVKSML